MRAGIVEFTTVTASFEEDVAAYAAAGADTIGILEPKLTLRDDDARRLLADARLEAGACIPAVPSILPLPLMAGPESPQERVEAICASVRRLAAFEPSCVLCLTGPAGGRDADEARRIVVEGLRRIAAEAAAAGVLFAVEPIQREFAHFWTIVSTLEDAAALADETGRDDIGFVFDTWHLWNDEGASAALERQIGTYLRRPCRRLARPDAEHERPRLPRRRHRAAGRSPPPPGPRRLRRRLRGGDLQ